VYREFSTGASNDLERCTQIARSMVKQFGMSRLGRICLHEAENSFLPGAPWSDSARPYSEYTAREIDGEVARILAECTEEVRQILSARRDALESVAQVLVEKEVIEGDELRELLIKNYPGPKLVPGTIFRARDKVAGFGAEGEAAPVSERRAEGGANSG
jgi:cell division protease FtsH